MLNTARTASLGLYLVMLCACAGNRPSPAPIEERGRQTIEDRAPTQTRVEANAREPVVTVAPSEPGPIVSTKTDTAPEAVAPLQIAAAETLLQSAIVAASEKDWDRAQASLERALRIEPDSPTLWRQLAYVHYRSGDSDQALLHAKRAQSLSAPGSAEYREAVSLISQIETRR